MTLLTLTPEPSATYHALHIRRGIEHAQVVHELHALAALALKVGGNPDAPLVTIPPMPCCGQHFIYPTPEAIPAQTTPCPCGAPNRYIIFYEE